MTGAVPVIQLVHLAKAFHGRPLFQHACLTCHQGEALAIVGPSGCGKTTLLRIICGLTAWDAGELRIQGRLVEAGKPYPRDLQGHLGMVFQHQHLFPHFTVLENVALAPRVAGGMTRAAARHHARQLLAQTGVEGLAARQPGDLSGGERQRVALARALAMAPLVLLLDEPVSALDQEAAEGITELLLRLHRHGTTMLVVSHQRDFATRCAQRVLSLGPMGLQADDA